MNAAEVSRVDLARAVLDAHDRVIDANRSEPPSGEYGMPASPDEWLRWHAETYKPAYAAWSEAMDAFNAATPPDEQVSRHPMNFRPECVRIILDGRAKS